MATISELEIIVKSDKHPYAIQWQHQPRHILLKGASCESHELVEVPAALVEELVDIDVLETRVPDEEALFTPPPPPDTPTAGIRSTLSVTSLSKQAGAKGQYDVESLHCNTPLALPADCTGITIGHIAGKANAALTDDFKVTSVG
jgi:hypothetical protein